MHSDALLVIVVGTALAFCFTNGFHDTASAVTSAISTRALSPRAAVAVASVLTFAGAFVSLKVASTIATGIISPSKVTESAMFAGLLGAITWNLLTWFLGLPSSSSHALIGGVVGALLAAVGGSGVKLGGLVTKVVLPGLVAPPVAFVLAGLIIVLIYRTVGHYRPGPVRRGFRRGQILSESALSFAHGSNDAQKTMGVIGLALVAHGDISAQHFHVPVWVVVASASAMALGTYAGGWRVIRTAGSRIIQIDSAQGFAAEAAGALVILVSSQSGFPISSTHAISGGVAGAGATTRLSAARWGVAGNIAVAWALTLPAAAALGAVFYWLQDLLGAGVIGPLVIDAVLVVGLARLLWTRRGRIAAAARA